MIRWFFRQIFRLIALLFLIIFFTAIYIVADGLNDQDQGADVAVVLGSGVQANGQPGVILRERLEKAVELYSLHKISLIIVSGGTRDHYSEPQSMSRYLQAHGVPATALMEDPRGFNTEETAENVAKIVKQRHLHSVLVITHFYHITRTKLALWHAGVPIGGQAHAGVVQAEYGLNLLREVAAIYFYLFRYCTPVFKEKSEILEQEIKKGDLK